MGSDQAAVQGVSVMQEAATQEEKIDLAGMVADLNGLLRLKTTVIGMKMFARAEDIAAVPEIPRPTAGRPTDPVVHMAPQPRRDRRSPPAHLRGRPRPARSR